MKRFALVLVCALLAAACAGEGGLREGAWALAVHGGAGDLSRTVDDAEREAYLNSLEQALRLGQDVLEQGGTSVDAVERVLNFLEDDPLFNAGRGAVFNRDGRHQLDASIMDGNSLACGAVAAVETIRNPISVARRVMENTPHVLLSGDGAQRFAKEQGFDSVDPEYFFTQERYEAFQEKRASMQGTVGAVALDSHGNLAAGTSTGGLTGKLPGRIGDSPIVGAGTYADDRTCAVSATGKGEEFIRHSVARTIALLMEYEGLSLQQAAERVILGTLQPGDGGVVALDRRGNIAMVYSTGSMFRGAVDASGRFEVAIWE